MQHGITHLGCALGHDDFGLWVFILEYGQGADVVQVGMGDKDAVRIRRPDESVVRFGFIPVLFGVHARVQYNAGALQLQ